MHVDHAVNRRIFLQQAGAVTLLTGLLFYKPCVAKKFIDHSSNTVDMVFSATEKKVIKAVQMQLFPADNDGPSAVDINALGYLAFALTDPKNIEDGDPAYIREGLTWLEKIAFKIGSKPFLMLSTQQQFQVIEKLSESEKGDNWISLLVYYLLEALLLDPVYGGNTNGVGWAWLGHQAGFPRPTREKNYRYYLSQT